MPGRAQRSQYLGVQQAVFQHYALRSSVSGSRRPVMQGLLGVGFW
jgi:hypothetical protein